MAGSSITGAVAAPSPVSPSQSSDVDSPRAQPLGLDAVAWTLQRLREVTFGSFLAIPQ